MVERRFIDRFRDLMRNYPRLAAKATELLLVGLSAGCKIVDEQNPISLTPTPVIAQEECTLIRKSEFNIAPEDYIKIAQCLFSDSYTFFHSTMSMEGFDVGELGNLNSLNTGTAKTEFGHHLRKYPTSVVDLAHFERSFENVMQGGDSVSWIAEITVKNRKKDSVEIFGLIWPPKLEVVDIGRKTGRIGKFDEIVFPEGIVKVQPLYIPITEGSILFIERDPQKSTNIPKPIDSTFLEKYEKELKERALAFQEQARIYEGGFFIGLFTDQFISTLVLITED